MTQAFREADATAVLPVDFTRLLWASLFGMLVFGETPELATLIGGTLIFVSTTYITFREARLARAAAARHDAALVDKEASTPLQTVSVKSERSA
jgi:drug/metabolite transporter (DMT)-like permease